MISAPVSLSRFAHLEEELHDLRARKPVEVAGGLVGKDDSRTAHKRTRKGHALLLAAGQLVREVVKTICKANLCK